MDVLTRPRSHSLPWPHHVFERAFDEPSIRHLEGLFERARTWQQHQSSLYDGALCDVSELLDHALRVALVQRMRELTGLPLTERVQVNVQRMAPGEDVRCHNDQPLLGYEAARVVLQLNRGWAPADGGLLRLHPGDELDSRERVSPAPATQLAPVYNSALAFVLSDVSYHSVTVTHRERRSVVFYFWHRGNDAKVERTLRALFDPMRIAQLPEAVQQRVDEADAHVPEPRGRRAALVAWALHTWGHASDTVEHAFCAHAWPPAASRDLATPACAGLDDPAFDDAAPDLALASWAAAVYDGAFDATRWSSLRARRLHAESDGARALWQLAFG